MSVVDWLDSTALAAFGSALSWDSPVRLPLWICTS